jgi:hypothetical protein
VKFFTPQAIDSFWSYDDFRAVQDAYWRYVESLRPPLPSHVLELAQLHGVQDGLVAFVDHDREARRLRLTVRCGYTDMGYYNLELTYVDAEVAPEQDAVLAKVARSVKTQSYHGCDLPYQELDLTADGRIEQRFIFHALEQFHPDAGGYLWFVVRCRELRWRAVPKRSRRLPPLVDRYPGGPPSQMPSKPSSFG